MEADRKARIELITEIETARDSKVITYLTGDRTGAQVQIGDDAIRPMYDHLLGLVPNAESEKLKRIDLFLYSRGGAVEVPWRIVSMFREFCEEFCVLVPYRAQSAATMVALGADEIIMGRKGELGPIDPSSRINREIPGPQRTERVQEQIQVEDMMSFVDFLKVRGGLTDQAGLAGALGILLEKLHPWVVGSMYRIHAHINSVARQLLDSKITKTDEARANAIIKALVEDINLHGHAVGLQEASSLGLPAKAAGQLDTTMWNLYLEYERLLKLDEPIDQATFIPAGQSEHIEAGLIFACIESTNLLHVFKGDFKGKAVRQMPGKLNLNVSINLPALPAGQQLDPAMQAALQQMLNQLQPQITADINQQLNSQAPIVSSSFAIEGAKWEVT